ncbi:hypothetical protein SAMN05421594_1522 [Chryseobacterium oleae]|uniref:DUF4303 domain-containing protein n=1 Tax=Chryseobacterium oleae TaxID=491207 RepID=A0A1I4X6W1_CHROL|nr:hypothetical protein [Chryseobacterium oleae]SFN21442.1 hypothetical protein SAMN05421594_1522 [Chryseobacterium oleae]
MQNLKQLNTDLKTYLEEITEQFVKDLVQILEGENADYLNGKSKTDIVAYYFEYEYDHLDISAWTVDKSGAIATKPVLLLTQREKQSHNKTDWNALLPEKIWKAASDFQEQHEDDDDFDDWWDEYNEEKYELFENWFFDGWKKASIETESRVDAYFSVHDTYFKTDLNTLQTINDDEIAERYTS